MGEGAPTGDCSCCSARWLPSAGSSLLVTLNHCLPALCSPCLPSPVPVPVQIITGALQADAGEILKARENMQIAYLTQVGAGRSAGGWQVPPAWLVGGCR